MIEENEKNVPLIDYINDFRSEVNQQNKLNEKVTKHIEITRGVLFNRPTKEMIKIDGITFTGRLTKIDASQKKQFTLVDKVWLIMKAIFEERKFTITETGLIIEHKN